MEKTPMVSRNSVPPVNRSFSFKLLIFSISLSLAFVLTTVRVNLSSAAELLEVTNKSKLKVLNVSPAIEYFKNECKTDHGNIVCFYEIYKSGYKIQLRNESKNESTVKVRLLLDYLGEGRVFEYLVYDIVSPRQTKIISLMCDNIPVDCLKKRGKEKMNTDCSRQALSMWDKHIKKLVVDTLD
jgi:hypothetical protein